MIQPTVLHNGFILQEIRRATHDPRYDELCKILIEWHELPWHDHEQPPELVVSAIREIKAMKLRAFARAGAIYQQALDAYERQRDWETAMHRAGVPYIKDTAVFYAEQPGDPIELDFDYPA